MFHLPKRLLFVCKKFSIRFIGVTLFFFHVLTVFAQDSGYWDNPYVGKDPTLLYYPDQNANYFRYGWENRPGLEIVIKGKIPEARYFGFNLYNDYTKSSIAALADYEILPDVGDSSSYTIHITQSAGNQRQPNTIVLPDTVRIASVFLRYYLARGDIYANKPLPSIHLWDNGVAKTTLPSLPPPSMTKGDMGKLNKLITAQPELLSNKEKKQLSSAKSTTAEKEPLISKALTMPVFKHFTDPNNISAYNFQSDGNYPNKDNHYIVMPVLRNKENILVVRFKAPGHGLFLGDMSANVRYYSISEGNEYTNTALTLHDEQLKISDDGFIYVVVGKDGNELRSKVSQLKINFMPWLYKDRLVLILRHMLPSPTFRNSTKEVPKFNNSKPAMGQGADLTIGDFALKGKFIKKTALNSFTGIGQLGF